MYLMTWFCLFINQKSSFPSQDSLEVASSSIVSVIDNTSNTPGDLVSSWYSSQPIGYCRDRNGYLPADPDFRLKTCASCYEYLFPNSSLIAAGLYLWPKSSISNSHEDTVGNSSNELFTNHSYNGRSSVISSTPFHWNDALFADIHNDIWSRKVCDTLAKDDCQRWKRCCQSAEECCQKQLEVRSATVQREVHWVNRSQYVMCPMTWDGYTCWSETAAGTRVLNVCPSFLPYVSSSGRTFLPELNLFSAQWTECFYNFQLMKNDCWQDHTLTKQSMHTPANETSFKKLLSETQLIHWSILQACRQITFLSGLEIGFE